MKPRNIVFKGGPKDGLQLDQFYTDCVVIKSESTEVKYQASGNEENEREVFQCQ